MIGKQEAELNNLQRAARPQASCHRLQLAHRLADAQQTWRRRTLAPHSKQQAGNGRSYSLLLAFQQSVSKQPGTLNPPEVGSQCEHLYGFK